MQQQCKHQFFFLGLFGSDHHCRLPSALVHITSVWYYFTVTLRELVLLSNGSRYVSAKIVVTQHISVYIHKCTFLVMIFTFKQTWHMHRLYMYIYG